MVGESGHWVLLNYRMPREPSTPRIALWRKLKKLGVAQLADGLVALPADARTREQLEWLADEVIEAGGQAGVWLAHPTIARQERDLAATLSEARAVEYRALSAAAAEACMLSPSARAAALRRLRTRWRHVTRRDFFPPPEREQARIALQELADRMGDTAEVPR